MKKGDICYYLLLFDSLYPHLPQEKRSLWLASLFPGPHFRQFLPAEYAFGFFFLSFAIYNNHDVGNFHFAGAAAAFAIPRWKMYSCSAFFAASGEAYTNAFILTSFEPNGWWISRSISASAAHLSSVHNN